MALLAAAIGGRGWEETGWGTVAVWAVLCAVSNVLPVPASTNTYLSMSAPVTVAVAHIFTPASAAALVGLASVSEWEVRRETTVLHAAFNRAQLAISAALASAVLGSGNPADMPPVWQALAGVAAYQSANWLLVALAERTARGTPVRVALRRLTPSGVPAAAIYLVLGLMGLALALASLRIGLWAVALLMVPLLGARHAVKVSNDLEQAERERRALADRLVGERERERLRIASHIHDVVLQRLAAVQLQADNVDAALDHGDADRAAELARTVQTTAATAIADLRGAIADLRRTAIDDDGLGPTVERFARSFGRQAGISVETEVAVRDGQVPPPVALLVYEACQELLTNVARHAAAMRARVALSSDHAGVRLCVIDDGKGIDPAAASRDDATGLRLLRERVAIAGGWLSTETLPHGGSEVCVQVPLGTPS